MYYGKNGILLSLFFLILWQARQELDKEEGELKDFEVVKLDVIRALIRTDTHNRLRQVIYPTECLALGFCVFIVLYIINTGASSLHLFLQILVREVMPQASCSGKHPGHPNSHLPPLFGCLLVLGLYSWPYNSYHKSLPPAKPWPSAVRPECHIHEDCVWSPPQTCFKVPQGKFWSHL